jgi:nuclear-control-of-ATPase protein 2
MYIQNFQSLERMTLSLARDSLQFTPQQLETLAEKIRLGDLTPVMQIYEEDIRHPVRSALTGTLLRNLFIQLQKAKVDIDQALSGIDKLLKSQELTFALVGVAPAFAIVYVLGGAVVRLWNGSIVKGRWGGRKRRRGVWEGLR